VVQWPSQKMANLTIWKAKNICCNAVRSSSSKTIK